jgi:hypothetical protein
MNRQLSGILGIIFIKTPALPIAMTFSKSFPRQTDKSMYPKWEEVFLTDEEEAAIEEEARKENIVLMKSCIDDARKIMKEKELKDFQTNLVRIAIALFEKRASHSVYWKESRAKDRFDGK